MSENVKPPSAVHPPSGESLGVRLREWFSNQRTWFGAWWFNLRAIDMKLVRSCGHVEEGKVLREWIARRQMTACSACVFYESLREQRERRGPGSRLRAEIMTRGIQDVPVSALEATAADEARKDKPQAPRTVCVSCGTTGDSGRMWATIDGRLWCDRHAGGHLPETVEVPTAAGMDLLRAAERTVEKQEESLALTQQITRDTFARLKERAECAEARAAAAQEDTARIDAVIEHGWYVSNNNASSTHRQQLPSGEWIYPDRNHVHHDAWVIVCHGHVIADGPNPRAAIDAARGAETGERDA